MRQKGFALILPIILIIVIALFGLFLFKNSTFKKQDSENLTNNVSDKNEQYGSIPVDTAQNWETYTDGYYDFEFSYPPDWDTMCSAPPNLEWNDTILCQVSAPGTFIDHGWLASGAYMVIAVTKPNANFSTLTDYVNFIDQNSSDHLEKRMINNIQGYQLTSPTNSQFIFESQGHFITIDRVVQNENTSLTPIVDQILSTFEFVE